MTMAATSVVSLTGFILPESASLRRDHVRSEDRRTEHYLERFDSTTLFYDCVYLQDEGAYVFTAPRFLNLWKPFTEGLKIDGQAPRRFNRRTWLRCEQVTVPSARGELTLDLEGKTYALASRTGTADAFAGLNCLLAVNKNNKLNWIRDWADYYVREHGLQAVALFDNGSTDYTPEDIVETLSGVSGLSAVQIHSAPFPYGPTDRGARFDVSPRFFQSAMLNIARRDALSAARAVLSVDIDEIVRKHGDASVFDLAARHPLGMVTVHGSWVYPPADVDGPVDQGVHVYRRVPDRKCNRKWCMTPDGLMSRFGWAVHQIGGVAQNLFTNTSKVSLLHCKGTSTGWKKKRFDMPEKIKKDPDLVDFMAKNFPLAEGTE
ncbi:hypothetical protein [Qingshengfaniella alkalisoli]|uniref:Glycosyl transferase family 2 n=1 Tax=Qingshengfaniella alkalisoli TaxID=2599296 RepID=A0A5B8ISJ1_9RHOB|nr:hypothetical protein [Qingshengfaniella alkalisoli]QDY69182.1 hypothetical protein FPZ52_05730 [Qingshengfaniella alkalisoli]